ncbi:DDE superfamily endonuclease [Hirsutella rhossiliensis]
MAQLRANRAHNSRRDKKWKGKDLQAQWFKDEFREFADWNYITSPNGWTDNHIAVEWLEEVYLPRTRPDDDSEARLIILDGHGSHATPFDNGVFNAIKAAYRKELDRLASLTDSTPVDKVNFIRARFMRLAEALAAGEAIPEIGSPKKAVVVDCDWLEEVVESETETASVIEVNVSGPPQRTTRQGRVIKRPRTN